MPGGFDDPTTGFMVFGAVKFLGYSAYSLCLNQFFPENRRNPLYVGFCRMIIGIGFGTVLGVLGLVAIFNIGIAGFLAYMALLVPMRALEWWIVLNAMYKVGWDSKGVKPALLIGVCVSFGLDIPAIAGFFATGGLWIC